MEGLRAAWRKGGEWVFGEHNRLPARDEHAVVADSLMAELDFYVKEFDRMFQESERDRQKKERGGVDYSWLIVKTPKGYEIPQLERLELEELCLKLEPSECTKVIQLFRNATVRQPRAEDLARIMRSCVIQILEQRPPSRSITGNMTEWVTRRANSLANLRVNVKPTSRVEPTGGDSRDDIEMQAGGPNRTTRALSMPNFTVAGEGGSTIYVVEGDFGAYPV